MRVQLCLSVSSLHRLSNDVLSGLTKSNLDTAIKWMDLEDGVCNIDRSEFVDVFENLVLRLDKLTQHQSEKLGDVMNLSDGLLTSASPARLRKSMRERV